MSCLMHVASAVISHLKKQPIGENSPSTDVLTRKKTMSVAKCIKDLAGTTTARYLEKASIVQIKPNLEASKVANKE